MIRYIIKLIRVIHSDTDPRQISLGFSLGMIPGLTPLSSPHNLIVLLVVLLFRVNISASILSWAVFSILANALREKVDGLVKSRKSQLLPQYIVVVK